MLKQQIEEHYNMSKKKKIKKSRNDNVEVWTEEQYEEYLAELYNMEDIAGFTEGGVPYGVFNGEVEYLVNTPKGYNYNDDEIPF